MVQNFLIFYLILFIYCLLNGQTDLSIYNIPFEGTIYSKFGPFKHKLSQRKNTDIFPLSTS